MKKGTFEGGGPWRALGWCPSCHGMPLKVLPGDVFLVIFVVLGYILRHLLTVLEHLSPKSFKRQVAILGFSFASSLLFALV